MPDAVLWFRRDLRLRDHPALLAAVGDGAVLPLFVLDDRMLASAGARRAAFLLGSLAALDADLREHGAALVVRRGRARDVVPAVAREAGATAVHVSADHAPHGMARDAQVESALGGIPLVRTGSPYAVAPGRLVTSTGRPHPTFAGFHRAWLDHGWRRPASSDLSDVRWRRVPSDAVEVVSDPSGPPPGEGAARDRWTRFRADLAGYPSTRGTVGDAASSRMSPYLRFGAIHPRTLLADLGADDDEFRRQLAWREYYASLLHAMPRTAWEYARPELRGLPWVTGALLRDRLSAWQEGRTGYPIVDAGMRQLAAEGWLPNRLRMVTASFLVKDLHVEWAHGARHFLRELVDADVASNQLGWQWVAGSGYHAAPFFRVLNPVLQSHAADPEGDYIRRWVPELADLPTPQVHEPWTGAVGAPAGYPERIVDHAAQRAEILDAHDLARDGRSRLER